LGGFFRGKENRQHGVSRSYCLIYSLRNSLLNCQP
jgi:hypothetical protein